MRKTTAFSRYAWTVLGVNVLVILWGAYVRATGSGAGCGSHWPLCNGQVIPRTTQVETAIEFAHRLSSGLALLLVFGMLIWALRSYPNGHPVRLGAQLSSFFIITEALVGAGLVLFNWVADDVSMGRVVSMGVHLVNTFLLLACLGLTAFWASGGERMVFRDQGVSVWLFGLGFLLVILLGVSGAITALGDTLFPSGSIAEGLRQDFSPTAHFLIRLRVYHPILAILSGLFIGVLTMLIAMFRANPMIHRWARRLLGLFVLQGIAGLVNLALLAPVWMQIVHLLLADMVWLSLVIFAAGNFGESELRHTTIEAAN